MDLYIIIIFKLKTKKYELQFRTQSGLTPLVRKAVLSIMALPLQSGKLLLEAMAHSKCCNYSFLSTSLSTKGVWGKCFVWLRAWFTNEEISLCFLFKSPFQCFFAWNINDSWYTFGERTFVLWTEAFKTITDILGLLNQFGSWDPTMTYTHV